MGIDQIVPKRWLGLSVTELIWHMNDPNEQELLVRFLMTKFLYRRNLIQNIEDESRVQDIKTLRLNILTILTDNDDYIEPWFAPAGYIRK